MLRSADLPDNLGSHLQIDSGGVLGTHVNGRMAEHRPGVVERAGPGGTLPGQVAQAAGTERRHAGTLASAGQGPWVGIIPVAAPAVLAGREDVLAGRLAREEGREHLATPR